MRVCWFTSSYPRWAGDGAGSFIASLAQALAERGQEIHVIAPWDQALQPMDTGAVRVHRFRYAPSDRLHLMGHARSLEADVKLKGIIPFLAPGYVLAALACARKLHQQHPFDLVHGHWSVPGGYIAGLFGRQHALPSLVSLHGSDVYLTGRSKIWAAAARAGFRYARFVTAPSQHLLERSQGAGLNPVRSRVIPYGVDVERFAHGTPDLLRQPFAIPAQAPVIGAVGRLVLKKGFNHLLSALPAVRARFPGVRCLIAGEGDCRLALSQQIQQLGLQDCVQLIGHLNWQGTPDFYAMCDVVVIPSIHDQAGNVDGLPNVLLEAMAAGRAVVASRTAGMDGVIEDGVSGALVPPGQAADLADAISELLQGAELRASLGASAATLVRNRYTWRSAAARFDELYAAVISNAE